MKNLGIVLFFLGVILMGLSGLEKVLIFSAFNGEVHQMQAIINLTPSYIWSITNITFGFGLISIFIGVVLYSIEFITQNTKQ